MLDITDVPPSLMKSIIKRLVEEGLMEEPKVDDEKDGKDKQKKGEKIIINPELNTNNSSVTSGVTATDQTGQGASGSTLQGSK